MSNLSKTKEEIIDQDFVLPFLIKNQLVNGKVVQLSESISTIIEQHNYPKPVAYLLAELLVFITYLGSNFKTSGIITIEVKSEKSPINLLMADYLLDDSGKGQIKGYASYNKSIDNIEQKAKFTDLVYDGKIMITLDLKDLKRYQGITKIEHETLSACLQQYMYQSQQTPTILKIVIAEYQVGNIHKWLANGIFVQRSATTNEDILNKQYDWDKIELFIKTINDSELIFIDDNPYDLLLKLFNEDIVIIYNKLKIIHSCRCNSKRMLDALELLSMEERNQIIKDNGFIEISCQFCNKVEIFQ